MRPGCCSHRINVLASTASRGQPKVGWPEGKAPLPRWSPTELGEQVFLRFHAAGADLDDVWSSGPAGQRE